MGTMMPAARKPKVAARGLGKPELDALVEEATVDCYNETESRSTRSGVP
jgi:hypothetical protein